jgi:NAD(P)H-flavin reductase
VADVNSWVPLRAIVRDARRESGDTVSLTLELPEMPAEAGRAGQFNMLYLFGRGECAVSLSGIAATADTVMHTVKSVGPLTGGLTALDAGAVVGVRGPFGSGWPLAQLRGRDLVLIGGGIGFAPLRPVIEYVAAHREDFGRVDVLYGCRGPADVLFVADLDRWRLLDGVTMHVTVDRSAPGWDGEVGFVTERLAGLALDPGRVAVLMCGPEVMMRHAVRNLGRRGVPDEAILLSMERNMRCAVRLCGHCQWGPHFVCRDGPVYRLDKVRAIFGLREL